MSDVKSHTKNKWVKAALLMAGLSIVILGAAATGLSMVKSDSPLSQEKQVELDKLRNPPTPDVPLGVTAAPGISTPDNTLSPRPDGLYDNALAPFPAMLYEFQSVYQTHIDGKLVLIYAGQLGYETGEDGRGVVVIDSRPFTPMTSLRAPATVGSLRIDSFDGTTLTIKAETGEQFYLDAVTRAFTDSNGDPVPTDSPTPTPYPNGDPSPGATLPFPWPTDTPPAGTSSPVPAPSNVAN